MFHRRSNKAKRQLAQEVRQEARRLKFSAIDFPTADLSSEPGVIESNDLFRQLAENIREVFWMTDPEKNRMLYVSPAYEEIWGQPCASLYASPRNWLDAIHPHDRCRVQEAAVTKQVLDEYNEVYRILRPDGTVRWIQDRAFSVRDESGKVYRVVGIARDISDRLRLERDVLEISARERKHIGHDLHDGLGQQLAAIAFKAKNLEQTLIASSLPYSNTVNEIVKLLNDAVGQTRRLARGLDPMDGEFTNLSVALQQLASETESVFRIPCTFWVDRRPWKLKPPIGQHLYRITQEAINNAINHGQARMIHIDLSSHERHICLTISDQGNGFVSEPNQPTGMGLRTMAYRAHAVGGVLQVDSELSQGTVIRCLVPKVLCLQKE